MIPRRTSPAALAGSLLLAACGEPGREDSASVTASGTSPLATAGSTGTGTDATGTAGTTTDGPGSDSATAPTTGEPTTSTTGPSSTSAPASTGTTGPVDETTGGATGPDCVPSPEVCNDVDDDCNQIIDDVDVGGDGICDCLSIALFGDKGSNPSAQFETWLEAQGTAVDRIQLDNAPVDPPTLDKYDIIILDRLVRSYSPQEAALIEGWVAAGGGLMSMTGYTGGPSDVDFPNSILGPMGLTYNNSQGIISGPVVDWTPHPISEGIASVTFLGGYYIDVTDDGVGTNTTVATLPPGPVGVAQVRAGGKLFVWGDEWIEFDSEWQQIPQIKKFWANILGWLAPQNFCVVPG